MTQSFFDVQSERVVLAAILQRGFAALPPDTTPTSGHCFSEPHGVLFEAAKALQENGSEVNIITVTNRLRETDQLEKAGGAASIATIGCESCFDAILRSACTSVTQQFKRRCIRNSIAAALEQVDEGGSDEALDYLERQLPQYKTDRPGSILAPSLLTEDALESMVIPARPVLLGDWFKAGDYGVLFGRRGLGKSWLAMGIARALLLRQ
jgi:replicative DNA helicase